ncbi:hypothetical protein ACIRF8_10500 [Streptomyces sp. NPDC102406]|uniref:hypothetical protein n=1 Tax=Streptomyces sp. NPDC102406 TaxID=3366171 RepID=UPI0037FD33E6
MSIPSLSRHPLRPTVLTLALAAGLCLASSGIAAAADRSTTTEGPAPTASAPAVSAGPTWDQETVDFTGGRIVYSDTSSGFDSAGGAYFEQYVLTVGGPDSLRWTTTHSHS